MFIKMGRAGVMRILVSLIGAAVFVIAAAVGFARWLDASASAPPEPESSNEYCCPDGRETAPFDKIYAVELISEQGGAPRGCPDLGVRWRVPLFDLDGGSAAFSICRGRFRLDGLVESDPLVDGYRSGAEPDDRRPIRFIGAPQCDLVLYEGEIAPVSALLATCIAKTGGGEPGEAYHFQIHQVSPLCARRQGRKCATP
ncbi:MAG: hypothetical protein ACFE0P_02750 [Oceanicaulis sp.]